MKRIIALLACALLVIGFASFAAASPPIVDTGQTMTMKIDTGQTMLYDTAIDVGTIRATDTATTLSTYNVMMTAKLRAATLSEDMTTVAMKIDYIDTATATYDTGQTMILDTGQTAKFTAHGTFAKTMTDRGGGLASATDLVGKALV